MCVCACWCIFVITLDELFYVIFMLVCLCTHNTTTSQRQRGGQQQSTSCVFLQLHWALSLLLRERLLCISFLAPAIVFVCMWCAFACFFVASKWGISSHVHEFGARVEIEVNSR